MESLVFKSLWYFDGTLSDFYSVDDKNASIKSKQKISFPLDASVDGTDENKKNKEKQNIWLKHLASVDASGMIYDYKWL